MKKDESNGHPKIWTHNPMCFPLVIALSMSLNSELCGAKLNVGFLFTMTQGQLQVLRMTILHFGCRSLSSNNDMFDSDVFSKVSYFQTSHLNWLKPSCSVLCWWKLIDPGLEILRLLDEFLSRVEEQVIQFQIHIDFSKYDYAQTRAPLATTARVKLLIYKSVAKERWIKLIYPHRTHHSPSCTCT